MDLDQHHNQKDHRHHHPCPDLYSIELLHHTCPAMEGANLHRCLVMVGIHLVSAGPSSSQTCPEMGRPQRKARPQSFRLSVVHLMTSVVEQILMTSTTWAVGLVTLQTSVA